MPQIKVGFVWPGAVAWVPNARVILVRSPELATNLRLIAHELRHTTDAKRLGWRWIPTYVWLWARAGFSYWNHPMEIAARRAEHDELHLAWARETIRKFTDGNG
jgi:RsiW-degrading membrane proteinase PrsW (M82 family)